jgi:hypothetical protein
MNSLHYCSRTEATWNPVQIKRAASWSNYTRRVTHWLPKQDLDFLSFNKPQTGISRQENTVKSIADIGIHFMYTCTSCPLFGSRLIDMEEGREKGRLRHPCALPHKTKWLQWEDGEQDQEPLPMATRIPKSVPSGIHAIASNEFTWRKMRVGYCEGRRQPAQCDKNDGISRGSYGVWPVFSRNSGHNIRPSF